MTLPAFVHWCASTGEPRLRDRAWPCCSWSTAGRMSGLLVGRRQSSCPLASSSTKCAAVGCRLTSSRHCGSSIHMAQKVFSPFMLGGLHVAPDELNRPRFGVDFPRGFDGASKEVFGLLQMLVPRRPFHPTAISDPESPPDPLFAHDQKRLEHRLHAHRKNRPGFKSGGIGIALLFVPAA